MRGESSQIPGTGSIPIAYRTYAGLTGQDRSGVGGQVSEQRARVRRRLAGVRRVVGVISGKGGVGKSYVTAHLAMALARSRRTVGVLDADFNGPTVARLLSVDPHVRIRLVDDAVEPAVGREGVRCMSMTFLLDAGQPLAFNGPDHDSFVWRGAAEAAALREFLADVAWGTLDALLVDLPPGTERSNELCDLLDQPPEAVAVTIPTPESEEAVRRALRAASSRGVRLLGVIENMAGPLFPGDAGATLSREFNLPLLGRLPFHPGPEVWNDLAARL